jgi:ABC-2 type transport system permease protein
MKDLLYKEFRLWWHPAGGISLLLGSFLLFPSWPFFIAFCYVFIAFNIVFIAGRGNQDILFTASLPVRKREAVLARVCFIAMVELLQVIVAIPFAIINNAVYIKGNMAGMNTNFAFFGLVLIMYAIFNVIFLPGFYKTAYNVAMSILLAIAAVIVYVVGVTIAVLFVPVLRTNLNGLGASHLSSQLTVLFPGIALFALLTLVAYRISANRFEKLDL